jgi:hypothetical protein
MQRGVAIIGRGISEPRGLPGRFAPKAAQPSGLLFSDAISLLKPPSVDFATARDCGKVVVGQLAPTHTHCASQLFPDPLDAIPIHRCAPTDAGWFHRPFMERKANGVPTWIVDTTWCDGAKSSVWWDASSIPM